MKNTTVLNVIDNFFGDKLPDFSTLSESTIAEFGEEVRRFAETYEPLVIEDEDVFPSYLGGWPSARWGEFSPLVMTSLLYSDRVLVKDLILDWFCDEQYQLPQVIDTDYGAVIYRNQRGYKLPHDTPEASIANTRYFLHRVIPMMVRVRPLIEQGILVLAQSKKFEYHNQQLAEDFATQLLPATIPNVNKFTQQFNPKDLPRSDDTRGLFALMQSSNRQIIEKQIRQEVREALYYLATEYLLAQHYGFTYTSTFPFEEYVCHNALSPLIRKQTGHNIYRSILTSKLPLYQGLTPDIIADIRDDDNFVDFRRDLYLTYANLPQDASGAEIKRHIRDAEEVLLRPILDKLQSNEKVGPLSRIGFTRIGAARLALGVFLNPAGVTMATGFGVLGEFIQRFAQRDRKKGASVIWKKLYDHGRSIKDEFDASEIKGTNTKKPYWGVPLKDGLTVSVTEGIMYTEFPKGTSEIGLHPHP